MRSTTTARPTPRLRCTSCVWSAGLTWLLLTTATSSGARDNANRSTKSSPPEPNPALITVNQVGPTAGGLSSGASLSLADALTRAATDPADNTITFDPALLSSGQLTIVLKEPIVLMDGQGHDHLEGMLRNTGNSTVDADSIAEPAVVLDVSACADAGLVLGGTTTLGLSRVAIKGGKQRSILVKDAASLALEEATVTQAGGPGMALFGSSQARIVRSRLEGNLTHGIEVHGTAQAALEKVIVRGNKQSGIAGFEASQLSVQQCRVEGNGHWNIVLTQTSRCTLESSTLNGARFANVDLSDDTRLTSRRTTIEAGGRFGIFATGRSIVEAEATRLLGNAGRGIELQNEARLNLRACQLDGNGDYGAILFESASAEVVGSTFTRNGGHGASLRGKATAAFKGCLFAGNRYSGLGCLDAGDGGKVAVTQCIFERNGMRPIYRGPLHLDPLTPTPLRIDGDTVDCLADPNAVVELYLDRAGEASRYLRTIQAGAKGRFEVDCRDVPAGWVMTAAATADSSTSEFNVIAGSMSSALMGALLAHTGPFSDNGGAISLDSSLRRWKPGTKLFLQLPDPPSAAVERYTRFVAEHVADWTSGAIEAELSTDAKAALPRGFVSVPIRYMPPNLPPLLGRGGVTYMKWDAEGYFVSPMQILLALGKEPADTCPRVLAHELGHVLGLCHARVGLLSRMQGSLAPAEAFVNDFSPMLTYYDVLALHLLHSASTPIPGSLRQMVAAGTLPPVAQTTLAAVPTTGQPTYSPPAAEPAQPQPQPDQRP